MVSRRKQGGFTVLEMLTVISIIGILAAIIFPIVGSTRRKAKQTQCIANMYHIFTALKQFQLDEHRYPDFLAGPVQWVDTNGDFLPYITGGPMVPLGKNSGMVDGRIVSLFPEYIDDPNTFRCPMSSLNVEDKDYLPDDPAHTIKDPMYLPLNNGGVMPNRNGIRGIGPQPSKWFWLYLYSAYDCERPKGGVPSGGAGSDEAHYCPTWLNMNDLANMNDPDPDVERQLRWKAPPVDTVITWCSYHRDVGSSGVEPGSKDLVLFLDGRVRIMPSSYMVDWTQTWRVRPGP